MEDGCRIGDPSFYQTKVDITHMDSPSSTMHRCTTKFWMDAGIWKVTVDGMHGSLFSVSNVINLDSERSTTPRVNSKAFCCIGKALSTSRVEMVVGFWAKLATML